MNEYSNKKSINDDSKVSNITIVPIDKEAPSSEK